MSCKATTLLITTGTLLRFKVFAQPVNRPLEWSEMGSNPRWPPIANEAPVVEAPLDTYDFLLFLLGLILVYILWQRNIGKTWKEVFSLKNAYSFLVLRI
jgi:hypothetical protein